MQKNLEDWLVEANVPIVSATQTTRSGYGSSDVELTDTSESFGLPATADLMFALISTEELEGTGTDTGETVEEPIQRSDYLQEVSSWVLTEPR